MDLILENYSVKDLKKMIHMTNIRRYSNLNKTRLIKLMLRSGHSARFRGIVLKSRSRNSPVGVVSFD